MNLATLYNSTDVMDVPPIALRQMMTGYWVSQSLYVAAKLGLADLLALTPQQPGSLAQATATDPQALLRLLRALASLGLLEENADGYFHLTLLGSYLRTEVPGSLRSLALWNGGLSYQVWRELEYSVKTGQPAARCVLGMGSFQYLAAHPELGEVFHTAMTGLARATAAAITRAYDFSEFDFVVDVGGGHGALLTAILQTSPRLRGLLFDAPSVINGAGKRIREAGLTSRCTLVAGDFFAGVPKGGDVYLLSSILHDWDDESCVRILKHCRAVMGKKSKLLLVECVIPAGNQPDFGKLLDLQMLVMTGGRERTQAEYQALLAAADFTLTRIISTSVAECVIEAVLSGEDV